MVIVAAVIMVSKGLTRSEYPFRGIRVMGEKVTLACGLIFYTN